ncbi:MAG: cobalamin-dependent protein [Pseudomonadota bacterium]
MADNSEFSPETERAAEAGLDTIPCASPTGYPMESSEDINPATNLLNTIEAEILPRLMLVQENDPSKALAEVGPEVSVDPQTVDTFVEMMFDQSVTSGQNFVEELLQQGVTTQRVYLDVLAPAARQMGELWEQDIRNFTDVTLGLCRLHEVLRHSAFQSLQGQIALAPDAPSILLSTACADQHVFGVIMVAEFFRNAGWQVTSEPGAATSELERILSEHSFDMVGLSVARSHDVDEIKRAVGQLRQSSRNRAIKVILGGALLERDRSIAEKVGADAFATDAADAPTAAAKLLADIRIGC